MDVAFTKFANVNNCGRGGACSSRGCSLREICEISLFGTSRTPSPTTNQMLPSPPRTSALLPLVSLKRGRGFLRDFVLPLPNRNIDYRRLLTPGEVARMCRRGWMLHSPNPRGASLRDVEDAVPYAKSANANGCGRGGACSSRLAWFVIFSGRRGRRPLRESVSHTDYLFHYTTMPLWVSTVQKPQPD